MTTSLSQEISSFDSSSLQWCQLLVLNVHMVATTAEKIRSRLRVHRDLPDPEQRRALREAAGLSQQELANTIGVTRQAVSHWETGARNIPRGQLLDRYVEVLNTLREADTPEAT